MESSEMFSLTVGCGKEMLMGKSGLQDRCEMTFPDYQKFYRTPI
jgi:hypothetical protein